MEFMRTIYGNKQYLMFVDGDLIEAEDQSALNLLLRLCTRGINVSPHLFAHCLK